MALRTAVALAVALAALVAPRAATAHGPCGCTFPPFADPGQRLRTGSAYKVIWNPAPRDFENQTTPLDFASGFRADAPTAVVLERPRTRPMRRATFRLPQKTPPGIYFVLIFDGSEGGQHTTWDYVQVLGRPAAREGQKPPAREREAGGSAGRPATDGSSAGLPVALGAAGALLILVALGAALRRSRL